MSTKRPAKSLPKTIRIVIASPSDVTQESDAAATIIEELAEAEKARYSLETFRWQEDVPPCLTKGTIQVDIIDPRARITDSDIIVAIFKHRFGMPIARGKPTGTHHEFLMAYESWKSTQHPQIMTYFNTTGCFPSTQEELDQYHAVQEFKLRFPTEGLYQRYKDLEDFEKKFKKNLLDVVNQVSQRLISAFSREGFEGYIKDLSVADYSSKKLANSGPFSSFSPENVEQPFRRLKVQTTDGYVPNPRYEHNLSESEWRSTPHTIYVIRDPVRPFEIQIGEYRAKRYGKEPREVPLEGLPGLRDLKNIYPLMLDSEHRWLRVVLAELINEPDTLAYLNGVEPDPSVKKLISRNPSAPDDIKKGECQFCKPRFKSSRVLSSNANSVIIANDFPFGPLFHYIAFPTAPIHSWDTIGETDLFSVNMLIHTFLESMYQQNQLSGSAGVRIGFNSSIRHLVLGRRTRTSAGASIAHVHKQIWGMLPGAVNLADNLRDLCAKYQKKGQDYLDAYLKALGRAKMVIWEDENVALFVPFGQIAAHELQIMLKRKKKTNFLNLEVDEIKSLSRAEYIVARLYALMDINSFNEIMLSLPFNDHSPSFRLLFTFITREVDLAVSELSLLYVVDRHPADTVIEIEKVWPSKKFEDLAGVTELQRSAT